MTGMNNQERPSAFNRVQKDNSNDRGLSQRPNQGQSKTEAQGHLHGQQGAHYISPAELLHANAIFEDFEEERNKKSDKRATLGKTKEQRKTVEGGILKKKDIHPRYDDINDLIEDKNKKKNDKDILNSTFNEGDARRSKMYKTIDDKKSKISIDRQFRNSMRPTNNLPIYDKNKKSDMSKIEKGFSTYTEDLYNICKNDKKSSKKDFDHSIDKDRSERDRAYQRTMSYRSKNSDKMMFGQNCCPEGHKLKADHGPFECSLCSEVYDDADCYICDICEYELCLSCLAPSSKKSSHQHKKRDNGSRRAYKRGKKSDSSDISDSEDNSKSLNKKGGRKNGDGDDSDKGSSDSSENDKKKNYKGNRRPRRGHGNSDPDDDGDGDDSDEGDEDESDDYASSTSSSAHRRRNRRHQNYNPAFQRRIDRRQDRFKKRKNLLDYRQKIMGPLKKYAVTDDFQLFYDDFLLRVKFFKLRPYEARIYLITHIADEFIKNQIQQILKAHPGANLDELGTHICISLGVKSKELVSAEGAGIYRNKANTYKSRARFTGYEGLRMT